MKKTLTVIGAMILICSTGAGFAQEINFNPIIKRNIITSFSFASDSEHYGPTFWGYENIIKSKAEIDLLVDLNEDYYGGLVTYLARLDFKAKIYDYSQYYIGNQWLHLWKTYAEMIFYHEDNSAKNPILSIVFKEALLISWSPTPNTLGQTLTLQASKSADPSIHMTPYPILIAIGITPDHLLLSETIAFTFTSIQPLRDPTGLVRIDKSGFVDEWKSEGSFSASARHGKIIIPPTEKQ